MEHGAQPTDRVVRILKAEGVKLPSWVKQTTQKQGALRNPEKLRKNRPAEEAAHEPAQEAEAPAEEPAKTDRTSVMEGKRGPESVDTGWTRNLTKTTTNNQ